MGKTSIEWTDASWNPIVGCTEISPGCANCYAARLAATRLKGTPPYNGLVKIVDVDATPQRWHWNSQLRFLPQRLEEPLHWRKPRRIFVCDMGDLFHEMVQWDWIGEVFRVMRDTPHHTYQVLTKRPEKMQEFMRVNPILPNVWLGVSVENQHFADERIPLLLSTRAAVRWISAEPLLGPLNITSKGRDGRALCGLYPPGKMDAPAIPQLDWVVCGGESGANARPMHPDWARSLRDQCQAAGVPFFFKQWGQWLPVGQGMWSPGEAKAYAAWNWMNCEMVKLGKKNAGRLLDGREWNEFPAVKA
jgi:protein gp37